MRIVIQPDDVPRPEPDLSQLRPRGPGWARPAGFYGVLLAAVVGVGAVCARELSFVYSLRGTVMGDLVLTKSPAAGTLSAVTAQPGRRVREGEPLFALDPAPLRNRLRQLETLRRSAEALVRQAEATVREEEERLRVFVDASGDKLRLMHTELHGLEIQLDFDRAQYDRVARLSARDIVSAQEAEVYRNAARLSANAVERKRREIALQEKVVRHGQTGRMITGHDRLFTGFAVKGDLPAAREGLARAARDLGQVELQIDDVRQQSAQYTVPAPVGGVVHHVQKLRGDSVAANEYVLSLTADGGSRYVAARFTAEDARYLAPGKPCQVTVPGRNLVLAGRVTAIGHTGLSGTGAVSVADESAAVEVPVKIEFDDPAAVPLRTGEGVTVKAERNWTFEGYFRKLF